MLMTWCERWQEVRSQNRLEKALGLGDQLCRVEPSLWWAVATGARHSYPLNPVIAPRLVSYIVYVVHVRRSLQINVRARERSAGEFRSGQRHACGIRRRRSAESGIS